MNIVVYTAIIGGIDSLWGVMPGNNNVRHIAFVDAEKKEVRLPGDKSQHFTPVWEQIVIRPQWDNRRTARHYKALPQRYIPDADMWVWVDGNVRSNVQILKVVNRYLDSDLVTFNHWDRHCLYVEAEFCAKINKDRRSILETQAERYRAAGMPRNWGLAATRVVIRRNTQAIRNLNEAWWQEMKNYSYRDQVSLPYVCWKAGIQWDVLPGKLYPGTKGEFVCIKHDRGANERRS